MRLRWLDGLVLVYGILLIAAGIDGYLHHSVISLVAGGASGALEVGFAALAASNPRVARIGSAVIALLILGRFLPIAIEKHTKVSIVLAAFSIIVFVCLIGGHFYAMSKKKSGLS